MRPVVALSLGILAGCASSGTTHTQTPDQTIRVSSSAGSGVYRTTTSTVARVDTLWVGIDRVWKALPAVYGTLEIPISKFDAESNVIGNTAFKVYRRLGKIPLTRYLDCGATQVGPNAESYEVQLTVITQIRVVGGGARQGQDGCFDRSRGDGASHPVLGEQRPVQLQGRARSARCRGAEGGARAVE